MYILLRLGQICKPYELWKVNTLDFEHAKVLILKKVIEKQQFHKYYEEGSINEYIKQYHNSNYGGLHIVPGDKRRYTARYNLDKIKRELDLLHHLLYGDKFDYKIIEDDFKKLTTLFTFFKVNDSNLEL